MPKDKQTLQHELSIELRFQGANRNGVYQLVDWGPIEKNWVADNQEKIKQLLGY